MKMTILGCGRWASFHAWYQAEILKNEVLIWGRAEDSIYDELKKFRKNNYLTLPDTVKLTDNLKSALDSAQHIIISISSQGLGDLTAAVKKHRPKDKIFILCMKGIDHKSGMRLSQILRSGIDGSNKICVWVGPGHVQDFLSGQPNIMLIDGDDETTTADVINSFRSELIKLYQGNDLIGSEIGAAAKNVIGIAAGMLDGASMSSLKGALMARGVYEVSMLIKAMGGRQLTAYGLSHLGDFEATLFSQNSHNRKYGEEFIKSNVKHRLMHTEGLAEGVETSKALMILSERYKVEMPICRLVYEILHESKDPKQGLNELFSRTYKNEFR